MPGYPRHQYTRFRYESPPKPGGMLYGGSPTPTQPPLTPVSWPAWDVAKNFHDVKDKFRKKGRYPVHPMWNCTVSLLRRRELPSMLQTGVLSYNFRQNNERELNRFLNEDTVWQSMPAWQGLAAVDFNPRSLVPDEILDDLLLEAFNYFSTVFPEVISIAEFTQGLFQLKDLIPQIGESMSKTISGGYLTKKFGWDNLLSDLGNLTDILDVLSKRMKYLKETYGKPQRLGFARHDIYSPSGDLLLPRVYHTDNVEQYRIQLQEYLCDFRATCWITQVIEHIDDTVGWIRALTSAFGLDNPVKAAWNLVPLSFVVDWFFKIDQHLDKLLTFRIPGWEVNDVSHSVKVKAVFHCDIHVDYLNQIIDQGYVDVSVYSRQVGLPLDQVNLIPDELDPEQLTLLLAILHQN